MNWLNRYFFVIFFVFCVFTGLSQPLIHEIHRDYFTRFLNFDELVKTDLSRITAITQDTSGYVWLAGPKGLYRYDGTRLKSYQPDTLPGSLPSRSVHSLFAGNDGKLWIGTHSGLCRYIPGNDRFETVFNSDEPDSAHIRAILAEGDSILWFETLPGYLYKMDQETKEILGYWKHQNTKQPYYPYHIIYRSHDGKLWVGGRGIPMMYLDGNTGNFITLPIGHPENRMKREQDVAVLLETSMDHFLVGGLDGLYLYDNDERTFDRIHTTSTWAAITDHQGNVWVGTGNGAGRLDLQNGELTLFLNQEDDPGSLKGNNVNFLFEDSFDNIWLATDKGVSIYRSPVEGVSYIFHIAGIDDSPSSSVITDLALAPDGRIWIGTFRHGIDLYEAETGMFRHYNPETLPGMPSGKIRCLLPMQDGSVFAGLWAGIGFGRVYPNGKYKHYRYDPLSLKMDWYNDLEYASGNDIYLGFWGADGLTVFDTETGLFSENSLKNKFSDPYLSRLITCLYKDGQERLWVGTTHTGIHRYDRLRDTSICYFEGIRPGGGFFENEVHDIAGDASGRIWAAGNDVYLYDKDSDSFKIFVNASPGTVFDIVALGDTTLWLLSDKGLISIDTRNAAIRDLSSLVNLRFSSDAGCGLEISPGRIMIGGENGLAVLEPDKLYAGSRTPEAFISQMDVFTHGLIHNPVNDTVIKLSYDENFMNIAIGTNEVGSGAAYRYSFLLENFTQDWQYLPPADMTARFTNIPPGYYTFRLRVDDETGVHSDQPPSFHLLISPPFWDTWWFILVASLLAAAGIYLFARWRMKNIRLALQNLEIQQKLLRLQMNPHFIFNSLSAIQNFIYTKQTHLAGDYLSEFARLIRMILENSRYEEISLDKEITFIELYLNLQQLRFEQKFDYILETDEDLDSENILVPPMLSQPFLENAIEHGIRHSPHRGKLLITFQLKDKGLLFVLEDNGIGLTASAELNAGRKKNHKSLAIEISRQRLEQLKKQSGIDITFRLEEITGDDGKVKGTRVSYLIPLQRRV